MINMMMITFKDRREGLGDTDRRPVFPQPLTPLYLNPSSIPDWQALLSQRLCCQQGLTRGQATCRSKVGPECMTDLAHQVIALVGTLAIVCWHASRHGMTHAGISDHSFNDRGLLVQAHRSRMSQMNSPRLLYVSALQLSHTVLAGRVAP